MECLSTDIFHLVLLWNAYPLPLRFMKLDTDLEDGQTSLMGVNVPVGTLFQTVNCTKWSEFLSLGRVLKISTYLPLTDGYPFR